ncbi:MAG: hypothetical protein M3Y50_14320 [Acidobacteriota bacterium]|nr:hypothetical protein [Acidobacteriota bacterium]
MKSHTFRSISAVLVTIALATVAFLVPTPTWAADKKAPPAKPAGEYLAFEAHPNEHVTVAAEPCDRASECDFFRLPYLQHGFIPIRVIFTNDGDTALSLEDARMQFISAENDKIPAASEDDLQRRLFNFKSATGHKIPLPMPLPPITIHGKPVDKQIIKDDDDFGFAGTVVNAHSTLAGYLFYDVRGLDEPALKGAELYVKMVRTLDGKKQLFDFNIPFNKWLAGRPRTTSASER